MSSWQLNGRRVSIYSNDHAPAHVHIKMGSGKVVIYLDDQATVRQVDKSVKANDVKKAQEIIAAYLAFLREKWDEIHPAK